jgi:hypothetical protein
MKRHGMLFKIEGVLFFFSFCAAVPRRPSPRPTAAATLAQPSPLPNTPPAAAPKQCLRRRRRRRSNPFSRRPNPRAATNPRAGTWG